MSWIKLADLPAGCSSCVVVLGLNFSLITIIASQHVSSRTFNCCHNSSSRGNLGRAARMASVSNKKEEVTFRPEGGRFPAHSRGKGRRVHSRGVFMHPAASCCREGISDCPVSDHASGPDPIFWSAPGNQTSDRELWRRVAAAVASNAKRAVHLPCAGVWLWMGKDIRRKKYLLHVFTFLVKGKIHLKSGNVGLEEF